MAKARAAGEGSLFRRKDGRWVGQLHIGWEGGRRKYRYVPAGERRRCASA